MFVSVVTCDNVLAAGGMMRVSEHRHRAESAAGGRGIEHERAGRVERVAGGVQQP